MAQISRSRRIRLERPTTRPPPTGLPISVTCCLSQSRIAGPIILIGHSILRDCLHRDGCEASQDLNLPGELAHIYKRQGPQNRSRAGIENLQAHDPVETGRFYGQQRFLHDVLRLANDEACGLLADGHRSPVSDGPRAETAAVVSCATCRAVTGKAAVLAPGVNATLAGAARAAKFALARGTTVPLGEAQ
jgi:hypothetical protein